ncbi:hypothetical protein ACPPVW_09040 [Leifsonia sp. McL0607]|uniref:hypothetical protein n=1 Tax=Leifsonia sp. McL0607 TaxID=3415672 RepID=UPI003CF46235
MADLDSDPAALLARVNEVMTPRRRSSDYWQANDYADDCSDTVELLADRATRASPQLIRVIERAITLTTRAIMRSDDSSGAQGDEIRTLLDAHATAVRTSTPSLTQAEQTRVVKWIVDYRYGGSQDAFDPDIVGYAESLSPKSLHRYREAIAALDLGPYGRYPLRRLAVLDRDRDAIVGAYGGEPANAFAAEYISRDLDEAGLHDDALEYAGIAIALDTRGWDQGMVTYIVEDAFARGDVETAVTARRDRFTRFPTSATFAPLRETAERAGVWGHERPAAESLLADGDAPGFAAYLLDEGRIDEAWQFATAKVPISGKHRLWLDLCKRRAQTHPSEALAVYRAIVDETLITADQKNYRTAAKLLKTMRSVSARAGSNAVAEFDTFLGETVERNRRRPTCIDAFVRADLISRR